MNQIYLNTILILPLSYLFYPILQEFVQWKMWVGGILLYGSLWQAEFGWNIIAQKP